MYRFHFDKVSGALEVTVVGLLGKDALARYHRDFRLAVDRARAEGPLRILIDASQGHALPTAVAERIEAMGTEVVDQPGDRVAVIVSSSLHKLQVRRVHESERTQAFLSASAARTWLNAYAPMSRAPALCAMH